MQRRSIFHTGLLALSVLALVTLETAPAQALAGCCKVKKGGTWAITKLSVEECMSENAADNDNMLQEAGKVWWDISC